MEAVDGSQRLNGHQPVLNRDRRPVYHYPPPPPPPPPPQPQPQQQQQQQHHHYPSSANPAHLYHNEPPPRYEVASSAFRARTSSLYSLISYPEPRWTPDHPNDLVPAQPPSRQSLPSIHEALAPQAAYASPASTTPSPSYESSYPPRSQTPPHPYAAAAAADPDPFLHKRPRSPPPPPPPAAILRPIECTPQSFNEPARHVAAPAPYARFEPTPFDPDATASAAAPPAARAVRDPPTSWKAGREDEKTDPVLNFRGGLKRNLDVWDFENNLAEINISSSALQEWSAHYNALAQDQQRSVSVLSDRMPTMDSIKDIRRHQEKIFNCLEHMTRIINDANQQNERATVEQRAPDIATRTLDYDDDLSSAHADEAKTHSYCSDAKKRRGRAAPPGRCHSCNRAETPEWRRGPDGARTLCNACGLHYAKLTRKNIVHKPPSTSGSSLRHKSMDVSPRPL
ncbi:unnamed protein product [Blumeria hordei]|uniref:GATA-type domain-containing protein n=1 Tax=Blumeria hordei TaxID=2867405 RepID=A0A383UQL7_BLUHO|nr:unnamed protein product [Blumeria hordei]